MTTVHYLSDLHLEFGGCASKLTGGDVLLVAGDLVCAEYLRPHRTDPHSRKVRKAVQAFLNKTVPQYQRIYGVMGNHEHYGGRFDETIDVLLYEIPGIRWLEKETVQEDGFLLYGATLWTDLNKGNPLVEMACKNGMNDFRAIKELTLETWKQDHKQALAAIPKEGPLVVMTHHAPSVYGVGAEGRDNPLDDLNYAFYSDLHQFIENRPNIKHWVHGHTHARSEYEVAHCKVHTFAHGYSRYAYWAKEFVI